MIVELLDGKQMVPWVGARRANREGGKGNTTISSIVGSLPALSATFL